MKLKRILKSIFITLLALILVGLAIIAFCDLNDSKEQNTIPINVNSDYRILDKTGDVCAQALDYFYSDETYTYYFSCIKSGSIYLEWENGNITKMMDELNSGNVTIDSLIEHGLSVNKVLKNEKH